MVPFDARGMSTLVKFPVWTRVCAARFRGWIETPPSMARVPRMRLPHSPPTMALPCRLVDPDGLERFPIPSRSTGGSDSPYPRTRAQGSGHFPFRSST